MFEAGNWYKSRGGFRWECIAIDGRHGWLRNDTGHYLTEYWYDGHWTEEPPPPRKVEGWVNVYRVFGASVIGDCVYPSFDAARADLEGAELICEATIYVTGTEGVGPE